MTLAVTIVIDIYIVDELLVIDGSSKLHIVEDLLTMRILGY